MEHDEKVKETLFKKQNKTKKEDKKEKREKLKR